MCERRSSSIRTGSEVMQEDLRQRGRCKTCLWHVTNDSDDLARNALATELTGNLVAYRVIAPARSSAPSTR